MSIATSQEPSSNQRLEIPKGLLAWWVPVMLGVMAFCSLIAVSFIPPAPSSVAVDLGQRMHELRAQPLSPTQARALDRAAETLEAAQRAITAEGEKAWNLRSYDRARALLWQAENLFDRAVEIPAPGRSNEVMPAG